MPGTTVCSEITKSNVRLAVRQAVADFCAVPERTVESIVNAQFKNLVEPIQRLIAARLESVYEQLQYSVLSPSNEAPSTVLRFLSEHNNESEKDIVRRFEKGSISSRRHVHGQRQKFRTPSQIPVNFTPPVVDVPLLENLTSGSSSSNNAIDKYQELVKNVQNSDFFCSKGTSITSKSLSFSSGNSSVQPVQESERSRQGLFSSGRKNSVTLSEETRQHMRSNGNVNMNDEILVEYKKATGSSSPVVLEKEFIPTVPSTEVTTYPTSKKSKIPASVWTSQYSGDSTGSVQYIPSKVLTMDAAVLTDHVFADDQPVGKTEIGVNTIVEMDGSITDSPCSNTTSDSAGQLPKRLFDAVLQRPSLKIVSFRPDGSIVPAVNCDSQHLPSVREWTPIVTEGDGEKPFLALESESEMYSVTEESNLNHSEDNGVDKLESVSASPSRAGPIEGDLNTVANISPFPDT